MSLTLLQSSTGGCVLIALVKNWKSKDFDAKRAVKREEQEERINTDKSFLSFFKLYFRLYIVPWNNDIISA